MTMSDADIVKEYREAKDKKAQIGILADLNTCSRDEIKEILIKGGVSPKELPRNRKKKDSTEQPCSPRISPEHRSDVIRSALRCYREHTISEMRKAEEEYQSKVAACVQTLDDINQILTSEYNEGEVEDG